MPPIALETFRKRNTLHDLVEVHKIGNQLFDYLLFPQHYENPEYLLTETNIEQVADYWRRVQEGLQLTTRRDDPNYDPGMNDGKFVNSALDAEAYNVLEELGIPFEGETQQLLGVDPLTLPSVQHTVITYGLINKISPRNLPYVNNFGEEAKRFWGRKLTVSTVREMTEDLSERVSDRLYNSTGSNFRILPVAQYYQTGLDLSSRIVRQAYYSEPYTALPESYS